MTSAFVKSTEATVKNSIQVEAATSVNKGIENLLHLVHKDIIAMKENKKR